jgi:hypothetical protein
VRRFLAGAAWFLTALIVIFVSLVIYTAWRPHR